MSSTSTPYDDVFRTLLNDCSSLILPVITEVFGECYTGEEEIIFSYEDQFWEYVRHADRLEELKAEYGRVRARLEALSESQKIDEYTKCTIIDMSNKVVEHIAAKYDQIREGVKSVMGGKVLDYEAKTIRNEGRQEGILKGRQEGIQEGILLTGKIFQKVKSNSGYKNEQIAKELGCTVEDVKSARKMFDL